MKNLMKILMLCLILFSITDIKAQLKGINYQGTLRNNDGNLMENEDVTVIFDIREGSGVGLSVFNETHSVTTNEYGGFSVVIGQGFANSGNLFSIDWSTDLYYLNVEVNGNDMGTSRFHDVPFAKHANVANRLANPIWIRDETTLEVYTDEKITIGSDSNDGELLFVSAPDVDSQDELVDFKVENLTTNRDLLNLEVGNTSSDFGQFIECRKGTDLRFKVDVDGSVLTTEINRNTSGNANLVPISYGRVSSSGVISVGGSTNNFSITKTVTGIYTITVNNETLDISNYTIQVSSQAAFAGPVISNYEFLSSGPNAGSLQIYSYSATSGSLIDNAFSFLIFKP